MTETRLRDPRTENADQHPRLRQLAPLGISLVFTSLVIWQIRQPWAKSQVWPWFLLIALAFVAAGNLVRIEPWLPGEPVTVGVAAFPAPRRRLWGIASIAGSLVLTALLVWRLWPDIDKWQGLQYLWFSALLLLLMGAWLIGAIGGASPRAATAVASWPDTLRNRWLEILAFVLILGLAVFLRTYRFYSIPPGIFVDETNAGLDALYVLEGRAVSPFATGWYGTPNGYIYYMAAIFKLLGANWTSLKLVSLIPAILTAPAVYLLGRLLFGRLPALIAMLLMAVSRWHLTMSRWGWNETAPPLFQVLAFFFLIRGLRDRRLLDYALGGLLTGLSMYTYLSARLAVITVAVYIMYWFLSDPSGLRTSIRRSWMGVLVAAAASIVAVAPLAVTYVTHPFTFNNRVSEVNVFREIKADGTIAPLLGNLGDMVKFFHQTGDFQGKQNLPGEPMLDPFTGLLFAVGVSYAVLRARDHHQLLLLMWLVIGLAGSYLSSHLESPHAYRTLTVVPAVALLAAGALDRSGRGLYHAIGERASGARHVSLPSLVAGAFIILMLSGATLWESNTYFGRQADSISVAAGFNLTENGVARETIAALESGETVYLSPDFSFGAPLRFLVYGFVKARTGGNALLEPPYRELAPEISLPVPDDGLPALILLDSQYWSLRDYLASIYPRARIELAQLADTTPLYMRVEVPQAQIAELQGLTEQLTYDDGRIEEHRVPQVDLGSTNPRPAEAEWNGAIRLEHGGNYDLHGLGGLQIYLDDQPWDPNSYLGQGLYTLRAVWKANSSSGAWPEMIWSVPGEGPSPVPAQALFHLSSPRPGLRATYFRGTTWEGPPVYSQITPFLMLAWPGDEQPNPNAPFSARFTGALRVIEAGTYGLRIQADDGARVTLDGRTIGEGLAPNQPNSFDVTVQLQSGDHPIQIDYVQMGGGSALRFFWRRGVEPWTPVPPSALVPPGP